MSAALDVSGGAGDERAAMLESAHMFLSAVVDPHVVEAERTGAFPWSIWPEVAEFGYIGIRLPAAVGGQELAYADLAVRDTRGGIIPDGMPEMQTLIIGRELTGLSAFS